MKSKQDLLKEQSGSYMRIRLHLDDCGQVKELRVPTFWCGQTRSWIGAVHLKTGKLLRATGASSFELQESFNKELYAVFESKDEHTDALVELFEEVNE